MNTLEGIAQRRPFHRVVIFLRDASGTYLHFSLSIMNGERLSQEPRRVEALMFSCTADVSERRHSVDRSSGWFL